MFRRRIEITRERWTRVTVRDPTPPLCPTCGLPPELIPLPDAAARTGRSTDELDQAVAAGLLQVWNAGEHRLVCLRCAGNLQRNDQHA
jgi:hypothetical protein